MYITSISLFEETHNGVADIATPQVSTVTARHKSWLALARLRIRSQTRDSPRPAAHSRAFRNTESLSPPRKPPSSAPREIGQRNVFFAAEPRNTADGQQVRTTPGTRRASERARRRGGSYPAKYDDVQLPPHGEETSRADLAR